MMLGQEELRVQKEEARCVISVQYAPRLKMVRRGASIKTLLRKTPIDNRGIAEKIIWTHGKIYSGWR